MRIARRSLAALPAFTVIACVAASARADGTEEPPVRLDPRAAAALREAPARLDISDRVELEGAQRAASEAATDLGAIRAHVPEQARDQLNRTIDSLDEHIIPSLRAAELKVQGLEKETEKVEQKLEETRQKKQLFENSLMISLIANLIALLGVLSKWPSRAERQMNRLRVLEKEAELREKGVLVGPGGGASC